MKIMVSYAFTGEDLVELRTRLRRVVDALEAVGHEVYCLEFAQSSGNMTDKQAMTIAFEHVLANDTLFVIQSSPRRSEGVLLEAGAALSHGKKVVVAQHSSAAASSYLPELADESFVWNDLGSLAELTSKHFAVS